MTTEYYIDVDGWLSGALHLLSPNYNDRPVGTDTQSISSDWVGAFGACPGKHLSGGESRSVHETYMTGRAEKATTPGLEMRRVEINLLVIHNISLPPGQFEGSYVSDFFLNRLNYDQHPYFESLKNLKVSSHFFIRRSGKIIQFVSCNKRAWHAGVSEFQGKMNCNDFSIGIELEGTDDQAFTDDQYDQLIRVTSLIQRAYPDITHDRIVGHADIAPGRKTDPGPFFDWKRLLCAIAK